MRELRACYCVGPKNGDPVCPCRMQYVHRRGDRIVEERDLGPAPVGHRKRLEDFVGEPFHAMLSEDSNA